MMTIQEIAEFVQRGKFQLSRHALTRMLERNISQAEFEEAFATAEIIEDYPDDKYLPSCLILCRTLAMRNLHVVITRKERQDGRLFVITMYEPDNYRLASGFQNKTKTGVRINGLRKRNLLFLWKHAFSGTRG